MTGSGSCAASLSASLTIPTGQYDIKRGTDASQEILPASFQKGSGLYSLTLGWDYSRDTDKGIWLYGLTFTYPFAMHLISGENEFNDSYWKNIEHDGDRFDIGLRTPSCKEKQDQEDASAVDRQPWSVQDAAVDKNTVVYDMDPDLIEPADKGKDEK